MSTVHPLPNADDVMGIFSMLYGADTEINGASPLPLDGDKTMIATYICDDDKTVCACLFDYNLGAFSGCALTRIPPGGAEDAAASGDFTEQMMGNINEVMNIASRLLMNSSSPHIRLGEIYHPGKAPDDVMAALQGCEGKEAFDVDIPKYGQGNLTFIAS